MSVLLSARGIGKLYPDAKLRRRKADRWSLRGVDLQVKAGEVVAVVGRNGAGKSTMLKLAAGVTRPTEGSLRRTRKIAPLIEVGAGFHPDLTGRENVALNGRLLGMSKEHSRARFDDIVEFAELSQVIDAPVKTYSSGMYMRLGFSVAVHTDPDLLLVDEVLSVGDLPFQVKCLDRIRELRESGTGILFVSHNLAAVQSLATRALLLEGGVTHAEGDTRDVIAAYHELLALGSRGDELGGEAGGTSPVRVVDVQVVDAEGDEKSLWNPGDHVVVRIHVEASEDTGPAVLGATLHKHGAGMVGSWLGWEAPRVAPILAGESRVIAFGLQLNVGAGSYTLDVGMGSADLSVKLFEQPVADFAVAQRPGGSGLVDFAPGLIEES